MVEMPGAILRVELRLLDCRSLKDKRSVLRPLLQSAEHRYHVATAEVDHADSHRLATIEIATVASAYHVVEAILDDVERHIWSLPGIEVTGSQRLYPEDS